MTNVLKCDIIDYKFNEDGILEEVKEYIDSTYAGHYAETKMQSTEVIIDRGHGEGFCMGNVDKYSARYGKKNGHNKADLMKILHYTIIQIFLHNSNQEEN